MRYKEYQPPIELASWIKLFWIFEDQSNDPIPETIVADGYPELIVHFRSPFAEIDPAGRILKQPAAIVCGQLTKPLLLQSSNSVGMIGIRFHPSGMAPFLSTPMHPLTDARVPAEHLFVNIDQLTEEIAKSSNDPQRLAACARFLTRSINLDRIKFYLRPALDKIMRTRGRISVESLASYMGRSRRSLELAFQREVGTSPKMYCRITRFRHIFDTISKTAPSVNWVQIALDSGFFDQPHMIRDFRQFTGNSPTSFLTDQTAFAQAVNRE